MIAEQGELLLASAAFKSDDATRPYIALGNNTHPFPNNEQICVVITTSKYEDSIEIYKSNFKKGGLPKKSYVSPWSVVLLKEVHIKSKRGRFDPDFVKKVSDKVKEYISVDVE